MTNIVKIKFILSDTILHFAFMFTNHSYQFREPLPLLETNEQIPFSFFLLLCSDGTLELKSNDYFYHGGSQIILFKF